jgi:hypothetical protein
VSAIIQPRPVLDICTQFTMNLAQAAATYDLCTASGGDVLVWAVNCHCTVVGATWTSVTIQSNATTNFVVMNATQGARANFTAGKDVALTWTQVEKFLVRSGNKIQYTIAGSTGTGSAVVTVMAQSVNGGILI